jgi:hypothetical protein
MDAPGRSPTFRRAAEHLLFGVGSGIASTVYGTIVVMATLTAAYATQKDPWRLVTIVWSAVIVLWIAHLYAHGLSESIVENRRLTRGEVRRLVRRELGILLAAALPTLALLLGAAHVFKESVAIWIAIAIGLVTLAAEGVRFARLERLGPLGILAAMGLNVALGLLVVALKVAVAH